MAAFAASASLRKNILTKAWRLSLFTMHVCTWPKRLNIWRNSLSAHLILKCLSTVRHPGGGNVEGGMHLLHNLRYTAHEESTTVYLDGATRDTVVIFDPLFLLAGLPFGTQAATTAGRGSLPILLHTTTTAPVIRTSTTRGRCRSAVVKSAVMAACPGRVSSAPTTGGRPGSRTPSRTTRRPHRFMVAIPITCVIGSCHLPGSWASRCRRRRSSIAGLSGLRHRHRRHLRSNSWQGHSRSGTSTRTGTSDTSLSHGLDYTSNLVNRNTLRGESSNELYSMGLTTNTTEWRRGRYLCRRSGSSCGMDGLGRWRKHRCEVYRRSSRL